MSRYIDAEWLKAFFEADKDKSRNTPIDSLLALIEDAPSIDIVRCCECYHFDNDSCYCTIFHGFMDDLGFCYVGDRKTKKDERRVYVKGVDDDRDNI